MSRVCTSRSVERVVGTHDASASRVRWLLQASEGSPAVVESLLVASAWESGGRTRPAVPRPGTDPRLEGLALLRRALSLESEPREQAGIWRQIGHACALKYDGAGFWGIYLRIMLPMSLPIFVVGMIIQITGIWNDFLFGVIFAGTQNYPMTVQLNNIVNAVQGVKEYNVNMAATLLTGAVPLIVYFVSGRLFVRGIAAGAVKG